MYCELLRSSVICADKT